MAGCRKSNPPLKNKTEIQPANQIRGWRPVHFAVYRNRRQPHNSAAGHSITVCVEDTFRLCLECISKCDRRDSDTAMPRVLPTDSRGAAGECEAACRAGDGDGT